MLSHEQILEIREHLEKAQNPVFFFDNDIDGLMSFVILRRYLGRGKGVAIKSFPGLDGSYIHKAEEFNSDYIIILDKPIVSKEFLEEAKNRNLPIIWIDHHEIESPISGDNLSYYNPIFSKEKSSEPISYIAYKIAMKKDDLWFAMAGSIADNFLPEFTNEFSKLHPELWKSDVSSAFQALYETDFGKIIQMLAFALKDKTSNVVYMINFLIAVKSPSDVFIENEKNSKILKRYSQVYKIYSNLLEKAKNVARSSRKVIFFHYGGDLSMSADLANELSYRFPGKIIIVAYVKGVYANISIRGKVDVRKITLEAISNLDEATGGGHKFATGAKVKVDDLQKFREYFERAVENQ